MLFSRLLLRLLPLLLMAVLTARAAGQQRAEVAPAVAPAASLIAKLPARSVGPMVNGRISALAVYEQDPRLFFVGSASGGVFKTEDGGRTFQAVFDRYGGSSIGDIAVSQSDPHLVWVGPGEGWHRNDVGWGDGIYKSTDGGRTWRNMGLPHSNSFGKLRIHPTNNDIVFAAVLGSAWATGPERGVYKTTDGGQSWRKVLYVNERTGAADLAIDPQNPRNMLAAMWDHQRRPYNYILGGPGSGLYRSTDGGETWHKVTQGLPRAELGRIAVDYHRRDPRHVAATIEVALPHTGFYRSMDGGETWVEMPAVPVDQQGKLRPDQVNAHWGRPYYDNLVRYDPVDVNRIYHGSPSHFTADGGKTFVGGVADVHALWINPSNPKHMLWGWDGGVWQLWNGEKTLTQREQLWLPAIGQVYAVGYDMRKLYRVMGGLQDDNSYAVPTQTRHGGVTYVDGEMFPVGDGSKVMADPEDWTTVYSLYPGSRMFRTDLRDGTSTLIDPLEKLGAFDAAYTGTRTYQRYLQSNPRLRAPALAPFLISPWNAKTLYFGANRLLKSVDRGETWTIISPDLTHDKREWQIPQTTYYEKDTSSDWAVFYQAIRTISESPLRQGLIWVGTDDGYVQLTRDGGARWTNVTKHIPGLPEYTWVSHIYASRFAEGRAYATFDGHRHGDLRTYVYVTEDYGQTWTKLTGNLPVKESCYVIKEGLRNPDLLFLGTEFGLWVSLDRGQRWSRYQDWELSEDRKGYFPTVAVHDLEIHPRELDLIIGTHGRSIWTLPIRALEELTAEHRQQDVYFVSPGNVYLFPTTVGQKYFQMANLPGDMSPNTQPGTLFAYHLKQGVSGEATLRITDAAGQEVYAELTGPAQAGLNVVPWGTWRKPLERLPIRRPGDYRVVLTVGGQEYVRTLHVEDASDEDVLTASPRGYPANEVYRERPRAITRQPD